MNIWPVVIDSQPAYLSAGTLESSLLLAPLGVGIVLEHVRASIAPVTRNALIIVPPRGAEHVGRRIAAFPGTRVTNPGEEVADALGSCHPSDVLLIVDPRYFPIRKSELLRLVTRFELDAWMTHQLVAFEPSISGTKERVTFDTRGQVRGVHRYYDRTTWPFMAGIAATVVPVACGILGDGCMPASLAQLRQIMTAQGVPGCDVRIEGDSFDLNDEAGYLGANEHLILQTIGRRCSRADLRAEPLYIGSGQHVHPSARLAGPVIIHAGVRIDEHVMVLGPTVIGEGAQIGSRTVITHTVIGSGATVPPGQTVRNCVWFSAGASDSLPSVRQATPAHANGAPSAGNHLPHTHVAQHGPARLDWFLKRWLDVTVSAIGLIVLSPVLLAVAIAVRLDSHGSCFYGDQREGLSGRRFRCWKFRTMLVGANAAQMELKGLDHTDGPHFKIDRDPRVTSVGRILRATNLDELPQLFNVLTGKMSLVGPRPSPFQENQVCVPWREARLSVRPGITGLWQVCRHDRSAGDFHQWIEYDLMYVQHFSFWLDLKVLAATLLTLGGQVGHASVGWLVPLVGAAAVKTDLAGKSPLPSENSPPVECGRRPLRTAHIPELDGVRGIAIAAVMALHFVGGITATNIVERTSAKVTSYGLWGVDLFFVLSGFLITGILVETKTAPRYFRDFYVRRALRIFPLYYTVLVVMFVLIPARVLARLDPALVELRSVQGWIWPYLTNVYLGFQESFSIPYLSHFWSLAIEEHFYLFWPALIFVLSRKGAMRLCVVLGLLSLGVRIWFSVTAPNLLALQTLTFCRLDALCAGSWFALSARGDDALSSMRTVGCLVASGAAILGLSLANVLSPGALGVLPARTLLLSVFFGLFIHAVTRHPEFSSVRMVLRAKWLRTLGKYSYGLYIFHGIVAYAMHRASPEAFLNRIIGDHLVAAALQIAFGVSVSMLMAVVSYELLERRFLMLKKYFDYARGAPPVGGREPAVTELMPTG